MTARFAFSFLAAAVAASSGALAAKDSNGADRAIVDGGRTSGAATVNVAAGNGNQQVNAGVFALGAVGQSTGSVLQERTGPRSGSGNRRSEARVADGAFSGSSGWQAINVAAGSDNQQVNLAVVAFGFEGQALTETILGQASAPTGPIGEQAESPPSRHSVAIGDRAFEKGSGLVQLSLVGGERNTSANIFALSVAGEAGQ